MGPALCFLPPEGAGESQQVASPTLLTHSGLILATDTFHGFKDIAENTAVSLTKRSSFVAWAYGEELGFRITSGVGHEKYLSQLNPCVSFYLYNNYLRKLTYKETALFSECPYFGDFDVAANYGRSV